MKILCKSNTQVFGHGIVSKGETIDWPDGQLFPPQVLGNFVCADNGMRLANVIPPPPENPDAGDKPPAKDPGDNPPENPPANGEGGERQPTAEEAAAEQKRAEKLATEELIKKTAALGKQKLIAALDASGVTYKGNASCEELAKTLLRSQGQEID